MSDVIETAGTGRAKCRRCQQKIDKGALRFGEKVPNAFGEGEATHWFHLSCAAEKRPDKVAAALSAFEGELPERERIAAIAAEGSENPKLASIVHAERAPSGRATCQQCHEKIAKDELRISFEREAEPMGIAATASIHARCGPAFFGSTGLLAKLERTSPELSAEELGELRTALG
jgi:NAD-dependent SIR2 family protein deacetylase